jgi:hypothetical protein
MRESVTGTEGRFGAKLVGVTQADSRARSPWTPLRTPEGRLHPLPTRLGGKAVCPAT